MRWAWIFLGGGLGAVLRYELGGWVQSHAGSAFPWGTLAVNASGCFAIGVLATLLEMRSLLGPEARIFLLIGVLGGYTTFSTYGIETWSLIESAEWMRGAGNAVGSVVVGLVAVASGVGLARILSR